MSRCSGPVADIRACSEIAPWSLRRSRGNARAATGYETGGFTVLEMLVVLVLLGLLTVLAAPNLERLYAGLTRNTERDHILRQFVDLGHYARQRGQTYVLLGTDDAQHGRPSESGGPPASVSGHTFTTETRYGRDQIPYSPDLPDGWEIQLDRPLVIRASGACLGARLTLVYRTVVDGEFVLEPPYCAVASDA